MGIKEKLAEIASVISNAVFKVEKRDRAGTFALIEYGEYMRMLEAVISGRNLVEAYRNVAIYIGGTSVPSDLSVNGVDDLAELELAEIEKAQGVKR